MNEIISWTDFSKVDMREGTIIEVTDFPKAQNPAYQVRIDFGSDLGIKNLLRKSPICTPRKVS